MFMKKVLAAAIVAAMASTTQAAVIGFESGALDPYFTYNQVSVGNGASNPYASSGYRQVANYTGSTYIAFNPWEASPSDFFLNGAGTFTLNSLVLAGAWGSQTLMVKGFNNGVELFSALAPVTPSAYNLNLGWAGIDQFRVFVDANGYTDYGFGGSGQHWVIDNITVDEAVVPEPAMLALLGLGLAGLGFTRRK